MGFTRGWESMPRDSRLTRHGSKRSRHRRTAPNLPLTFVQAIAPGGSHKVTGHFPFDFEHPAIRAEAAIDAALDSHATIPSILRAALKAQLPACFEGLPHPHN